MFSCQVFAKPFPFFVGLTAAGYIIAAAPAITLSPGAPSPADPAAANSKPDSAMQCALRQYIPWVRAQGRPLDPDLKAKKLQEIDKACGSSLHLSNVVTACDSPVSAAPESKQLSAAAIPAPPGAPTPGPDIVALTRPLIADLNKPEYFQSRCTVPPVLANDKRCVAMSRDPTFLSGDRLLAINGEALDSTNPRALHEILIRYAPNVRVTVRALRARPANNEWLTDRELASQWLLMPDRQDADKHVPRPDPAAMTKTWIVYEGARVEIPLFGYYRVLYDPKRDEYVQFSIDRRDAD
jgi:hypothetical protein